MTRIPLQGKDDFEHFRVATQVNFLGDSPVNHALIAVAQKVAELLKQAYLVQADGIDRTGATAIRTIDPEYRQIIDHEEYPSPFASSPPSTTDQKSVYE